MKENGSFAIMDLSVKGEIEMDEFLKTAIKYLNSFIAFLTAHLSIEMMIYIAIAFLVLILVLLISKSIKRRKAERRLTDLEIEMNEIRNNTLSFKFNKAAAFARSNSDILEKVRTLKPKYESCMQSIQSCEEFFSEADEKVDRRKYKKAGNAMDELDQIIGDTKEKIRIITQALDLILVKEKEVREESNAVKERFGNLKTVYQDNRTSFYEASLYFDAMLLEIENDFSNFEEWMFASEFDKAKEELDKISDKIDQTSSKIASYPGMYEKAKIILPRALSEVKAHVQELKDANVEIDFNNSDAQLASAEEELNRVVNLLDKGNGEDANALLSNIGDVILTVQDELVKEKQAYDEIHGNLSANLGMIDVVEEDVREIESLYTNIKDRFGLEDWSHRFALIDQEIIDLKEKRDTIQEGLENVETPNSELIHDYRILAEKVNECANQVKSMKQLLIGASSDENRAKKQLIKLQLIMNEVRLNAATKSLPSISSQFDEDIVEGQRLIGRVKTVLEHSPLDIQTLNADLQEAIDFVYKLYNNSNNLMGISVMVENAIVFGNRFRSSYPEMDTELTKAELCYQNGEYTKALKIAIQAIENMHPGIYEKLVARKDPAVMNQVQ